MPVRFELLGPLRAYDAERRPVDLGPAKQRLLLAALLLRPNELVPTAELVHALWGDEPPASAAANLRTYARGLRKALGSHGAWPGLPPAEGGYLLRLSAGRRDLDEFQERTASAERALADGDPARAQQELEAALALWRGTPLAGLPSHPPLSRWTAGVEEQRLFAEEMYGEVLLATGSPADAVRRMRALLDRAPLRERAWRQLLLGLYRMGDTAGALDAFAQARRMFAEETGLDPGPRLTALHDDILHHRPHLADGPATAVQPGPVPSPPTAPPRQLPPVAHAFVGRRDALRQLDAALARAGEQAGGIPVVAVSGMAGVGKTTLAVHWAHRVSEHFPDGQLYVNLRGYDAGSALSASDALGAFLHALGVPPAKVPHDTDARTGLFRSLLADRRTLIVLDNARDSAQARPLLPGAGRGLVVVTSRERLGGLIATEGARPLPLGTLTPQECRTLLRDRVGERRLTAEPRPVADIIAATGRLPLALTIVAARMATHPGFPLKAVADELRPDADRLDALADGDVRAVLSWSYRELSPPAARLFRLLGLHPGPDVDTGAAAALADVPTADVRPLLRELTRLHLLSEHTPGRYAAHDLLRVYAAELIRTAESGPVRRAAFERLYDHYLQSAHRAAVLLQPHWLPIEPLPPLRPPSAPPVSDHAAALAWITAEHPVLLRVVRQAAQDGHGSQAWRTAWALTTYLAPSGLWQDQRTVQRLALDAASSADDVPGQATAHRLLARALTRLDDPAAAEHHLTRATHLYERLGDLPGLAQTLHNLMELSFMNGSPQDALAHGRRALPLHRGSGNRSGEARTLNAVGWILATTGEYHQAIESCEAALAHLRQTGDANGQAATLDSLGFAYHHVDSYDRAVSCYRESVALFIESADRYHEAETRVRLGETLEAMGDPPAARAEWRLAAVAFEELGDPAADAVRRRLATDGAHERAG